MPRSQAVGVVALQRITRRSAEVTEVALGRGPVQVRAGLILVVAGGRVGDALKRSPTGVIDRVVVRELAILVLGVAQRGYRVRREVAHDLSSPEVPALVQRLVRGRCAR